eukprot:TRINITY_DN793_c0_g1_i1.p1 TRINITY_DN793_c0_g1~~TRINITY_DN793_c0_g1_i1.p1  ORF type:complete len:165 (-),score=21.73 TRINITY_DN793_c0_g1_i1:127-621(-)
MGVVNSSILQDSKASSYSTDSAPTVALNLQTDADYSSVLSGNLKKTPMEFLVSKYEREVPFAHNAIRIAFIANEAYHAYIFELKYNPDNNQNILSIQREKPEKNRTHKYNMNSSFIAYLPGEKLLEIARETITGHGQYSITANNCRHFTSNVYEKLQKHKIFWM